MIETYCTSISCIVVTRSSTDVTTVLYSGAIRGKQEGSTRLAQQEEGGFWWRASKTREGIEEAQDESDDIQLSAHRTIKLVQAIVSMSRIRNSKAYINVS